jgi:hypothetical protein
LYLDRSSNRTTTTTIPKTFFLLLFRHLSDLLLAAPFSLDSNSPAGSAALDGGAAGAAEFPDAHVADAPGKFDDSDDDTSLYCYPPNRGPAAIPTAEGAHDAQISAESRAHADVDCVPTATATGDGIAADEDWAGVAGISRFEQSMHLWSLSYD